MDGCIHLRGNKFLCQFQIPISIFKYLLNLFCNWYLNHLKKKIRQKARVEGSICKSYLEEEASFFFSHYFKDNVNLSFLSVPRNDEVVEPHCSKKLSIFRQYGRPAGKCSELWLDDKDFHVAHTYILLNCVEVAPFVR